MKIAALRARSAQEHRKVVARALAGNGRSLAETDAHFRRQCSGAPKASSICRSNCATRSSASKLPASAAPPPYIFSMTAGGARP